MKSKMKKLAVLGLTGAMCIGILSAFASQPRTQQTETGKSKPPTSTEAESEYTKWLTEELTKTYGEYIDESAKKYKGSDLLADE